MAKALVLLATGFEEIEAITTIDILRRCNVEVTVAGLIPDVVEGAHQMKFIPDKSIEEISVKYFDAIICPGGDPGYKNLQKDERVIRIIKEAHDSDKLIAAICGAPSVLSDAGILENKLCTIYPGMEKELERGGGKPRKDIVVVDGNILTSRGPATVLPFAFKLAEMLMGKEIVENIRKETLADIISNK